MANPNNIFAREDYIWLKADKDENLKAIRAFHPHKNKLVLLVQESFGAQSLLEVSEVLSHSFQRWKLTNVW